MKYVFPLANGSDVKIRISAVSPQTYLPCYLVVILAWVTFWVDREHATARIVMSVTTMVAMVALLVSARVAVPRVSYMKALDLFLFICLLFVFFATLEYVLVSYLMFKIRTEGKDGATCKQVRCSAWLFASV